MPEIVIYEPDLGLNGTIPELVNWAERYTSDYSDPALERISELAMLHGLDGKYVEIPLLVRNERRFEGNGTLKSAYARMQIDHYLGGKIGYSESNYGEEGTELEIREENDKILVALNGSDGQGCWTAAGAWSIDEFMGKANSWLDSAVGQVLAYSKQYEEE